MHQRLRSRRAHLTRRVRAAWRGVLAGVMVVSVSACPRAVAPLPGAPTAATLPRIELTGAKRIVFRWSFSEEFIVARGEGVARIVAPDSARLDFFADGGFGSGYALLFGERFVTPGGDLVRNILPSAPMMWAAVGRLAVPALADTVATVDEGILRADIGRGPTWRIAVQDGRLVSLEYIEEGRVVESVTRDADGSVRYANPRTRRVLRITITQEETVQGFDAAIWRP